MIKLDRINKKFDNIIFENCSVEFNDCGLYSIVGKSGIGKSTLLNVISAVDLVDSGNIYINDVNIRMLNEFEREEFIHKNIFYIFQENNLNDKLSVIENINLNVDISVERDIIEAVLKELNIFALKNNLVCTLSGGEKQKVIITKAILSNAKIIIADEITSNLDHKTSCIVMEKLKELAKHKLVIISSHDMEMVNNYSDYIYSIKDYNLHKLYESFSKDNSNKKIVDSNKYVKPSNINKVFLKNEWKYNRYHLSIKSVILLLIISLLVVLTSLFAFSDIKLLKIKNIKNNGVYNIRVLNNADDDKIDHGYRVSNVNPYSDYQNTISTIIFTKNNSYNLLSGRFPINSNEIIISDYMAKSFVKLYNLESIYDYKVQIYIDDLYEFEIVGIYDTPYEKFIDSSNYYSNEIFNYNKDFYCQAISYSGQDNSFINEINYFDCAYYLNDTAYYNRIINKVDDDKVIYKYNDRVDNMVNAYITLSYVQKYYKKDSHEIINNLDKYISLMKHDYILENELRNKRYSLNILGIYDDSMYDEQSILVVESFDEFNEKIEEYVNVMDFENYDFIKLNDIQLSYDMEFFNHVHTVLQIIQVVNVLFLVILSLLLVSIFSLLCYNYYNENISSFAIYCQNGLKRRKLQKYMVFRSFIITILCVLLILSLYLFLLLFDKISIFGSVQMFIFNFNYIFILYIIFLLFFTNVLNFYIIKNRNKLICYKNINMYK